MKKNFYDYILAFFNKGGAGMADFKVISKFEPMGDQINAIETLSEGILSGKKHQTLMGVTGSGKTFTVAKPLSA